MKSLKKIERKPVYLKEPGCALMIRITIRTRVRRNRSQIVAMLFGTG